MCEPATIIGATSLLIGAASAIMQGQQAQAQAKSQNAYQEAQAAEYAKAAAQNNQAAVQEYVEQSAAERISQMQEQEAAAGEIAEQQKTRLQNQGTMIASSNAAGVAMDLLMGDYERQEAANKQRIHAQYANTATNAELALNTYKNKAQNRINSQQGYVYMESDNSFGNTLGTALGIGSAALNAYDKYSTAKAKTGTQPSGGNTLTRAQQGLDPYGYQH